ncbi:MAG: hypothetical protein EB154_06610 [Nitrosopumilaceae archaeon]|nr:hypothetical protein [Nitrosopumilaceae archaeon]
MVWIIGSSAYACGQYEEEIDAGVMNIDADIITIKTTDKILFVTLSGSLGFSDFTMMYADNIDATNNIAIVCC